VRIDAAKERLDGRPTAVNLNTLAGYDRDIGVVGEECEGSVEVLRREAAAEIVDRSQDAVDIGHTRH
jgi:hypothetical protein